MIYIVSEVSIKIISWYFIEIDELIIKFIIGKELEQPKQFWEVKIKLEDNLILTLIIKLKQSRHFNIDRNINNEIGLPRWLSTKESTCQAGDVGAIPGSGRLAGERNGSSILEWEILWREEPGGLHFMESQKVRCNLVTKQQQQTIEQ